MAFRSNFWSRNTSESALPNFTPKNSYANSEVHISMSLYTMIYYEWGRAVGTIYMSLKVAYVHRLSCLCSYISPHANNQDRNKSLGHILGGSPNTIQIYTLLHERWTTIGTEFYLCLTINAHWVPMYNNIFNNYQTLILLSNRERPSRAYNPARDRQTVEKKKIKCSRREEGDALPGGAEYYTIIKVMKYIYKLSRIVSSWFVRLNM